MSVLERFRPLFYPRGVAISGVSAHPGKWGFLFLHHLMRFGYAGKIFPINRDGAEVLGRATMRSVEEVPTGGLRTYYCVSCGSPLPMPDASVDAIISNCVVNLSPDKPQVFREALRVLRPGGRLVVSDLVLKRELGDALRHDVNLYVGCIAGASLKQEYLQLIREAGFRDVQVVEEHGYDVGMQNLPAGGPEREAFSAVTSVKVRAIKAV